MHSPSPSPSRVPSRDHSTLCHARVRNLGMNGGYEHRGRHVHGANVSCECPFHPDPYRGGRDHVLGHDHDPSRRANP